jgi:mono/diheme cytochrome c family protein
MNYRILVAIALLVGFGCLAQAQEKPKINRAPAKQTSPVSGSDMFVAYCAACHGSEGKGNGPAAAALKKQPADLTQLSKKNGGKFPVEEVTRFIKGDEMIVYHGSRDMPIWGQVFRQMGEATQTTSLRVHNLAAYVETLQQK